MGENASEDVLTELAKLLGRLIPTLRISTRMIELLKSVDFLEIATAGSTQEFREIEGLYKSLSLIMGNISEVDRILTLKFTEAEINGSFYKRPRQRADERDYEMKKEIVKYTNEMFRYRSVSIKHPDSGEPCLLLAVGSRDGHGRYILENRETKKRSHASKSFADLLPLRLMEAPARKEGILGIRKKKPKD